MSLKRSRRRFLVATSNGLLVGLTGCSALQPSRTQLGAITVLNMDDTEHRVSVKITADGETVFERSLQAPPASEPQPVFTHQDGLPTERREYTVTARLDNGTYSVQRTYPRPNKHGDCYAIVIRIRPDGTMNDMPSESYSERCATNTDNSPSAES